MTLYLTPSEKALYDKLPATLKEEWGGEVNEERGTAWETEELLMEKTKAIFSKKVPATVKAFFQEVVQRTQSGVSTANLDFTLIPNSFIHSFLQIIGAVGVRSIMQQALQKVSNTKMLDDIAALSDIHHTLLRTNAQYFSPAAHGSYAQKC